MQQEQATMVSVIPLRTEQWHASTLFATMRYFWTLIRFRSSKPRAAANAWAIERTVLLDRFENDDSLPLSMEVETTTARYVANDKKYRLVMSNQRLGLRYEKRWSSQVETSIRLLYPQSKKRWYQVFLLVGMLVAALVPYIALFYTPWALVVIVLQFAVAYYYHMHVGTRYRLIGALLTPYIIVQEVLLMLTSVYKYNFGTITWKGRAITNTK